MFGKRDGEGGLQARIHALNAKRERPAAAPAAPAGTNGANVVRALPRADTAPADMTVEEARALVEPAVVAAIDVATARSKQRGDLSKQVEEIVRATLEQNKVTL